MKNIITIAKSTFRETIRDKILYSILGFALLFIVSTIFFGSISLGEDIKIIRDFGLAGIYIFSIIIAIFVGTSLVYKELEKRTLYITLSKPVSRAQFVVGKFMGLMLCLILVILLMTTVYLIVVAAKGGGFDYRGLIAIIMSLPELAIFVALSILFSTFSTPLASTIYAVIVLYIGHSLELAVKFFTKSGGAGYYIFKALYYILPNLEKFNLRNIAVHQVNLSLSAIIYSLLYGIVYVTILLLLANWSLKKTEL